MKRPEFLEQFNSLKTTLTNEEIKRMNECCLGGQTENSSVNENYIAFYKELNHLYDFFLDHLIKQKEFDLFSYFFQYYNPDDESQKLTLIDQFRNLSKESITCIGKHNDGGIIGMVLISPSEKFLVTCAMSAENTYIWDASNYSLITIIPGMFLSASFSRDDSKLFLCSSVQPTLLYDTSNWTLIDTYSSMFLGIFVDSMEYFISIPTTGRIQKCQISDGVFIQASTFSSSYPMERYSISPSKKSICYFNEQLDLVVFDVESLERVFRLEDHNDILTVFLFNDEELFVCFEDNTMSKYSIETGQLIKERMMNFSITDCFVIDDEHFGICATNFSMASNEFSECCIKVINSDTLEDFTALDDVGIPLVCSLSSNKLLIGGSSDSDNVEAVTDVDVRVIELDNVHGNALQIVSLVEENFDELVDLFIGIAKKNHGGIVSRLMRKSSKISLKNLRILVSRGLIMNKDEAPLVFESCFDLVDINKSNGGNLAELMDADDTDDEEDDD
eukprot:TRINITY_DN3296_c2_g2_i3.p1 TRINITY_DN3296_c2_g2~~TRINITY_DN3296_c2_g2_i3.p1  ORF type:complete len:503 (+),score=134.46 TRINITY_DN3296_c2_g2_i3:232-1740(+)